MRATCHRTEGARHLFAAYELGEEKQVWTILLRVCGHDFGIRWNHHPFGIILFVRRWLRDGIERRAVVGVVVRGGLDGLIGEQVGGHAWAYGRVGNAACRHVGPDFRGRTATP
jgi:hypothetical protein